MSTPWITIFEPRPQARLRLFCLPFAGGGASLFRLWSRGLPASIEVAAVQLPGRESRIRDPLVSRLDPLVRAMADALGDSLDRPYALFGHSMGALLAFELAREVRRRRLAAPVRLVASGRRAPHLSEDAEPIHRLDDAAFVARLQQRYNAIPEAVLAEKDLMDLFLPILRSDFELIETYDHRPEPPLDVPIDAFAGLEDRQATRAEVEAWREHTRDPFELRTFAGGHFFLQTHRDDVLAALGAILA